MAIKGEKMIHPRKQKEMLDAVHDFPVFQIISNPKLSAKATRKRIDTCRNDIFKFVEYYAVGLDHVSFNKMHHWMGERFLKNGIWTVLGGRKLAKTWFLKWCELKIIAHQERNFCGIISEFEFLAELNIQSIVQICKSEAYELLQNDYELCDKINPLKKTDGIKINDVMFMPFSYRAGARGVQGGGTGFDRPDWIAIDDYEKWATSANIDINKSKQHSVKAEIYPAMSPTKRTVFWVGNYLRTNCAIGLQYEENKHKGNCLLFPCLDKKGNSNWKEVYPNSYWQEEKEIVGELVFSTEYMQKPINGSGHFKEEYIKYMSFKDMPKFKKIICYHDPSFSEKTSACYKAFIVLGMDFDGNFYLLDVIIDRIDYDEFLIKMYESYLDYNASIVFFENNGDQFENKIRPHWNKFQYKDRMSIDFDYAEGNKIERIDGQLQIFAARQIFINESLIYKDDFSRWYQQYLSFPAFPLDGLDALAGGIKKIKDFQYETEIYVPKAPERFFK